MLSTALCEIAAKHGTDKVGHGYTVFYDLLFRTRRAHIRKVLEIGIGYPACMQHVPDYKTGASLFMWEEYFPEAQVYGLDISPDCLVNTGRIQSRQADQRNRVELIAAAEWAGGGFDLILDDGLHEAPAQGTCALTLVPYLSPGGVYIIEDVAAPDELSGLLPFEHSITTFQASSTSRRDRLILIQQEAVNRL